MATEQRLLAGRYELGEVLGFGGMAEVLRGRDIRLGRDVAVKILRADLARDPAFINRFRREAQAAASLNHPAIVSVFDTGEDDGTPYIVMEYVAGRTLRDVLRNDGRLLPRRALEIVAAVCAALEYSHRAGIVHRDIKPGNVMLTGSGDVKVMDFGIARALAATAATATQTANVMGTAQYLSPEQARGEAVDARSDVYSAGCLLYELLTGAPPFQGDSPVAVAYQHVREAPRPPSEIDPELPPSLDAVVMKALAKNAANRYQSAGEFRADLERAAAGRRVEATPLLREDRTRVIGAGVASGAAATTVLAPASESDPRRSRRGLVYALLALLVLIVFFGAAYAFRSLFSGATSSVTVPNLYGRTVAEARATLASHHLKLGTQTVYAEGTHNDTLGKGLVFSQSPPANVSANENSTVDLYVSGGSERVTVPSVQGKSLSAAEAALKAAGLTYTEMPESVPKVAANTVTGVSPGVGTTVKIGSSVTLTYATGKVELPDLNGEVLSDAEATISQLGLPTPSVTYVNEPGVQPDTVINTSPNGNTLVAQNTVVKVEVQEPMTPSPTPTPSSPSPSTTPSSSSPSTSPTPSSPSSSSGGGLATQSP